MSAILKELEKIVKEEKVSGSSSQYLRNSLKEYLQAYVLYYVYTSKDHNKNLIFTGGTCLRHFFNLPRLSEDLDFDYLRKPNSKKLGEALSDFFIKQFKYYEIHTSIKQQGKQILLKFPVLHKLRLASKSESDLLYIKLDLSKNPSKHYSLLTSAKSLYGFNFAARHYDLPDLMAGKIHAILSRTVFKGKESRESVKGRDYFDLLWFIKNSVRPNIKRLSDMLGKTITIKDAEKQLDLKVKELMKKHKSDFHSDLIPFLPNPDIVASYMESYEEEYLRYKANSFATMLNLMLECNKCKKKFSSGITISQESLKTTDLQKNRHQCPYCGNTNVADKKDYLLQKI